MYVCVCIEYTHCVLCQLKIKHITDSVCFTLLRVNQYERVHRVFFVAAKSHSVFDVKGGRSRPRLNRDDALNVTMTIKNDNNNMVIITISIVFNDTIL